MNLIIYLIVAAVIVWVATEYIMPDSSNLLINIIVAVFGAFLAGYFLSPIFNLGSIKAAITILAMLVTLLSFVILLGNRPLCPLKINI